MWKKWLLTFLLSFPLAAFAVPTDDDEVVEMAEIEIAWLTLSIPVLNFATQVLKLPLDVTIQTEPPHNYSPIGLVFEGGKCHLVLSIRDNPVAHALVASMDEGIEDVLVQAVMAHEIGHCWRLTRGEAGSVPPNFNLTAAKDPKVRKANMLRREEGFADLVGLAWTLKHHPQHYERVHAWFIKARSGAPSGAPHDTRTWLRLAKRSTLEKAPGSIFEQAKHVWQRGLKE